MITCHRDQQSTSFPTFHSDYGFRTVTDRGDAVKIEMNAAEEDQVAHRRECECQSGGPYAPEPANVNAQP